MNRIRKKIKLLTLTLACSFAAIFLLLRPISAETARFYPSTCLGEWQGSKNAQGQPELSGSSEQAEFNVNNSALYPGEDQKIYCGGFEGEIPSDAEIVGVDLKLVWFFEATQTIIHSEPEGGVVDEIKEVLPETEPQAEETSKEEIPEQTETEEPVVPETEPETEPVQEPAEEAPVEENPAPTETAPVPEEPSATEESDQQAFSFVKRALAEEKEEFELKYTLDGEEWNSFGNVNKNNLQSKFNIGLNSLSDLSKVQVAIEPLDGASETIVYLDGLYFEISYKEQVITENILEPDEESVETEDGSQAVRFPPHRVFDKSIEVDSEAKQSCGINPFMVKVQLNQSRDLFVQINHPDEGSFDLEIGSLPYGVDVRFDSSDDYHLDDLNAAQKTRLVIKAYAGAQSGSFNVPILVTKKSFLGLGKSSSILCQFNVLIRE
jgi:hypothetical protein